MHRGSICIISSLDAYVKYNIENLVEFYKAPCVEDKERMFVRVDDTKPRRVSNIRIGDQALDPDQTYKLVTNDYILMDGDGFTMFRDCEVPDRHG